MPIKTIEADINVLEAAKLRIKNAWALGKKMYLSFSSGKDSLCVSSLVYDLAMQGEIDASRLTVFFIDEEALYPSMVKAAQTWRKKFLLIGAKFVWYCLPFKQVCTLDTLSASESWITWEPGKEDVWMRTPPKYAVMKSKYLHYSGEMNYQHFCDTAFSDGITLIGLRAYESFTRIALFAKQAGKSNADNRKLYPIYDWTDNDVWLYIKERQLDFPEVYMRLYEAGVKKGQLRLSAFFGDKTTQGLRWIAETDPDLWEKIERRMPNAYLTMLYWDSEMFARSSKSRKQLEEECDDKDYKAMCKDLLFTNTDCYNIGGDTRKHISTWRGLFIKSMGIATNADYKAIYEAVLAGDPKCRSFRTIYSNIYKAYMEDIRNGKR